MTKFQLSRDLYTYQKEDSERMLSLGSALNFSEMGVGKTPETLQVIEKGRYKIPLIVCPNSLRWEWKRQIDEWVGEEQCAVCTGGAEMKALQLINSFKEGKKYRIINYEALRIPLMVEMMSHIPFDIIVFDEIHKLRNPRTKLVEGYTKKDKSLEDYILGKTKDKEGGAWNFLNHHNEAQVIGLSGSPIMNYPNDLYVPLSCVRPTDYPRSINPWRRFMYKYCMWADSRYGPYIYGTRRLEELREETEPFTIRRTKKEVLPFLPEKIHKRTPLEMKPDQRKLYNQMERELKVLLDTGEPLYSPNVLAALTRLRQINLDPKILGITCSSAKTEFIFDTIEATDEKVVIFSTFERYIDLIHTLLRDTSHVVITGRIHPDKRIENVRQFQEDESIKVCLGTIQAMGEGVTLTAASNCLLADRWWNAPSNLQAEDRLHRIGQKNSVQIILPIVKDSVDAVLDDILERKHEASHAYYQEKEVRQTILGGI